MVNHLWDPTPALRVVVLIQGCCMCQGLKLRNYADKYRKMAPSFFRQSMLAVWLWWIMRVSIFFWGGSSCSTCRALNTETVETEAEECCHPLQVLVLLSVWDSSWDWSCWRPKPKNTTCVKYLLVVTSWGSKYWESVETVISNYLHSQNFCLRLP